MSLLQRVLVGLWFAVIVGITARLGEDICLYATLRQNRLQLQRELQMLNHQATVLQNKLRYLYTPDGIRWVQRSQLMGVGNEKIFVLEDGLLPISMTELLPGGFEEWEEKKVQQPRKNRWLVRLSRHWQRLRSERYR